LAAACSSTPSREPSDGGALDAGGLDAAASSPDAQAGDAAPVTDAETQDSSPSADAHAGITFPGLPAIPRGNGPLIDRLDLVTVTFRGEPNRRAYEAYGDWVVGSDWLRQVGSEYGVGGHTHLAKVALSTRAPDFTTDQALQQRIARIATSTLAPRPTPETLYILYLPSTASIDVGGGVTIDCNHAGDSYHNGATIGALTLNYAVVLPCVPPMSQRTPLAWAEIVAGHEIIEAMTDPFPVTATSYKIQDPSSPWAYIGGEVGDFCAGFSALDSSGHFIQRIWSNQKAAAGDTPCVPQDEASPYFAATATTSVLSAGAGATLRVSIEGRSTRAIPAWSVTAFQLFGSVVVTPSVDQPSLGIGDRATLSVSIPATAPSSSVVVIAVASFRSPNDPYDHDVTFWPIVISVQ
jgi:hypothetical protein